MDQPEPGFDVTVSVISRNRFRFILEPLLCISLVVFGLYLQPDGVSYTLALESLETWTGVGFLGLAIVGSGVVMGLKSLLFAIRARGTSGNWHFKLANESLLWLVPNHAFGEELGFEVPLNEIKEIEERYISKFEDTNETQYWVHFQKYPSIQLQSYSGVSIAWLTSEIARKGVTYNQTTVDEECLAQDSAPIRN